MLKLHKVIDGTKHYWETWNVSENAAVIHWGQLGHEGKVENIRRGYVSDLRNQIQKEVDKKLQEGYSEPSDDDLKLLEIEYKIAGFGTDDDLDKRHRLEEKLDELLGWTGLGQCNGGSIGSGTMEVGCIVFDIDLAKSVIVESLKDTEFSDYSRIFELEK